jgi:hypothetical protein
MLCTCIVQDQDRSLGRTREENRENNTHDDLNEKWAFLLNKLSQQNLTGRQKALQSNFSYNRVVYENFYGVYKQCFEMSH